MFGIMYAYYDLGCFPINKVWYSIVYILYNEVIEWSHQSIVGQVENRHIQINFMWFSCCTFHDGSMSFSCVTIGDH